MIFLAFCIGFICCAFPVLLIIISWPVRRPPLPTKYIRRYRDAPARTLSRELQEGIDYKFLGMGDREDVR